MAAKVSPQPVNKQNVYRITQVKTLPLLKLEDEEEMHRLEREAEARGAEPEEFVKIRTSFSGKMLTQDHERLDELKRREDLAKIKEENNSEGSISNPSVGNSGGESKG